MIKTIATILSFFFVSLTFAQKKITVRLPGNGYVSFQGGVVVDAGFTFSLASSATVSSGVYQIDGTDTTLIRTLFTLIPYSSGTHEVKWDGTNDTGSVMPEGNYLICVVSGNPVYEWLGVVGNTSDHFTGDDMHRGMDFLSNMSVTSTKGYIGMGYAEGFSSNKKINLATPNQRSGILESLGAGQNTNYVTTDDSLVYWGGFEPTPTGNKENYVFATRQANDAQYNFSSGTAYNGHVDYIKIIAYDTTARDAMSGLAVQRTANFLFTAYGIANKIIVNNKVTGAFIDSIKTFTNPRSLAFDGSNNLWLISSTGTVSKHTINSTTAVPSAAVLTLSGLVRPLAIGISKDNATVLVIDGGTSQQLKTFSNVDGSAIATFGQVGGYENSTLVSDDRFYFDNDFITSPAIKIPFVTFQDDGKFWLSDPGNYRVLKFNTDFTVADRISYFGRLYSVYLDQSDSTRLFNEFLELKLDYSKTFDNGTNGSWSLHRNWRRKVTTDYFQEKSIFKGITTVSGRTYSIMRKLSPSTHVAVELDTSYGIRFITSINLGLTNASLRWLNRDGSLTRITGNSFGGTQTWTRQALSSIDGSHNPVWGSDVVLASTNQTANTNPIMAGAATKVTGATSGGVLPSYYTNPTVAQGYRLGGIKLGGNKWYWKTAYPTYDDYDGPFPKPDRFDIGNNVINAGNLTHVIDWSIFAGYNGENWKNVQANMWSHFHENGLAIGQFGVTRYSIDDGTAHEWMAGNANSSQMVKIGDYFLLFYSDESDHSGAGVGKISGLNTVQVQTILLNASFIRGDEKPAIVGTDLMTGLPFNSILTDGTGGWTRSPTAENSGATIWSIITNDKIYDKRQTNDIRVLLTPTGGVMASPHTLSRSLGSNSGLAYWKLSSNINFERNNANNGTLNLYNYVLDNAGKVLVRIYIVSESGLFKTYANGVLLSTATNISRDQIFHPYEIQYLDGILSIKFDNGSWQTLSIYDGTSDVQNPTTFQIMITAGTGNSKQVGFNQLIFDK